MARGPGPPPPKRGGASDTGPPLSNTTTVFGLASKTLRSSFNCTGGKLSESRSIPSRSTTSLIPTKRMATSAFFAALTASATLASGLSDSKIPLPRA